MVSAIFSYHVPLIMLQKSKSGVMHTCPALIYVNKVCYDMRQYHQPDRNGKKRLPVTAGGRYIQSVAAKSATGRCNPDMFEATPDALSVFFYVATLTHLHLSACSRIESMVALVGQPKGWPVLSNAGIATPANVTTPLERCNSGGDSLTLFEEIATMATTPTQPHPKYQYRFMALDRADRQAKPCKIIVEATSETEARKVLAPHYILSLAAVLPVQGGVRHA